MHPKASRRYLNKPCLTKGILKLVIKEEKEGIADIHSYSRLITNRFCDVSEEDKPIKFNAIPEQTLTATKY